MRDRIEQQRFVHLRVGGVPAMAIGQTGEAFVEAWEFADQIVER